jgi:hypothetical protein
MISAHPSQAADLRPILAQSGLGELPLTWIPAAAVPPPFHQLLVHQHDMTSALESFHGDSITLTVIASHQSAGAYFREVSLHAATTGAPVEYGLIEILLDAFPADLRPLILAGKIPLGAILNASKLPYRSAPQGFFSVPGEPLGEIFQQSCGGETLFGRYNHLICAEATCLARIIEILPPVARR